MNGLCFVATSMRDLRVTLVALYSKKLPFYSSESLFSLYVPSEWLTVKAKFAKSIRFNDIMYCWVLSKGNVHLQKWFYWIPVSELSIVKIPTLPKANPL